MNELDSNFIVINHPQYGDNTKTVHIRNEVEAFVFRYILQGVQKGITF